MEGVRAEVGGSPCGGKGAGRAAGASSWLCGESTPPTPRLYDVAEGGNAHTHTPLTLISPESEAMTRESLAVCACMRGMDPPASRAASTRIWDGEGVGGRGGEARGWGDLRGSLGGRG